MRPLVRTTKALADENRIRILGALKGRELCVCQIISLLNLAPSTVSRHLSILRNARLISSRKQGRWMHYRLAGRDAPESVAAALKWVLISFEKSSRRVADEHRLETILKIDPESLCRLQTRPEDCQAQRRVQAG